MLEETVQQEKAPLWVIVPMVYEKWVHPGSKEKHYRAIFRNARGQRRYSIKKFKRASDALEYAKKFHLHLCVKRREVDAVRGQGDNRA
jgi:hypothetical protein